MGGTDSSDLDIIKPSTVSSQSTVSNSNNQDLLDLLGGLDTATPAPINSGLDSVISENNNFTLNQNSNFLMGDFLNTNIVNSKEILSVLIVCLLQSRFSERCAYNYRI